jgi:serine/threonine-protein kinase RsbW/stage II sporulation protein AB (anti-sigma F factor)
MSSLRWHFPAAPQSVADARRAARTAAHSYGLDARLIDAIALCVSEAVTNAVIHAYRGHVQPGCVEVEARKPDSFICIYVRDAGSGMEPRTDSPGSGFGLPMIAELASDVSIRSGDPEAPGTELAMRFDLQS